MAKYPDLLAQVSAGMQNLESRTEFSGRLVIAVRREFRHFPQSNCRQKQKEEPREAADISGGTRPEKPGHRCNREYNERRDTPPVIRRAGPPRASQHQQRRNDREE